MCRPDCARDRAARGLHLQGRCPLSHPPHTTHPHRGKEKAKGPRSPGPFTNEFPARDCADPRKRTTLPGLRPRRLRPSWTASTKRHEGRSPLPTMTDGPSPLPPFVPFLFPSPRLRALMLSREDPAEPGARTGPTYGPSLDIRRAFAIMEARRMTAEGRNEFSGSEEGLRCQSMLKRPGARNFRP